MLNPHAPPVSSAAIVVAEQPEIYTIAVRTLCRRIIICRGKQAADFIVSEDMGNKFTTGQFSIDLRNVCTVTSVIQVYSEISHDDFFVMM